MLAALAELSGLSDAQQRGLITAVAEMRPDLLEVIAARDDLSEDATVCLLGAAPEFLLPEILDRIQLDRPVFDKVAEESGATPALVVYCGQRGWLDRAVELAGQIHPADIDTAAHRWARVLGSEPPDDVRTALVNAALHETEPRPDLREMSEWDRKKALERLQAQREARDQRVWHLLQGAPHLWHDLVRQGEHAVTIQRILLASAAELSDDVLLECLPEIRGDRLRDLGDEMFAGIRLQELQVHVRRWPRVRELAPNELGRVLQEAIEDGWTPRGSKYFGPDWKSLSAVAELAEDADLLAEAVAALQADNPWIRRPNHEEAERWTTERAAAAAVLAANPQTPRQAVIGILPALDKAALVEILPRVTETVADAVQEQLARLEEAAASREVKIVEVPHDDELSLLPDPTEELRKHLRQLRGRAKQRDATCDALLRSVFTDDNVLRALPAKRVLNSAKQGKRVARMISDACGDRPERWAVLPMHSDSQSGTFGQWLDQLADRHGGSTD